MSYVQVKDAEGAFIEFAEVYGVRMGCSDSPEAAAARFKGLSAMPCREDDVCICSTMKSGTHWIWELASMLCNGKAESIPKSKAEHMIEYEASEKIAELPSPRVLNSHVLYDQLPVEMKEKRCKIVLQLRNPKDVAVSHFHHTSGITVYKYEGKWENFLQLFLEGRVDYMSWFDYVKKWEELIKNNPEVPIHVVYYEDLIENNLEEVYRLGKFLDIDNKDNLFEKVSQKCHFDQMKKDKFYKPAMQSWLKGDFTFYRKGVIGDWKNHFTVAQSEAFDKIYDKRMNNSILKFRFENQKPKNVSG